MKKYKNIVEIKDEISEVILKRDRDLIPQEKYQLKCYEDPIRLSQDTLRELMKINTTLNILGIVVGFILSIILIILINI